MSTLLLSSSIPPHITGMWTKQRKRALISFICVNYIVYDIKSFSVRRKAKLSSFIKITTEQMEYNCALSLLCGWRKSRIYRDDVDGNNLSLAQLMTL